MSPGHSYIRFKSVGFIGYLNFLLAQLQPHPSEAELSQQEQAKNTESIRQHLKRFSGVDLSVVDGFGVSLAQTVIMEVGTDMCKFPSEKQF